MVMMQECLTKSDCLCADCQKMKPLNPALRFQARKANEFTYTEMSTEIGRTWTHRTRGQQSLFTGSFGTVPRNRSYKFRIDAG
jgi:hypothetical protein